MKHFEPTATAEKSRDGMYRVVLTGGFPIAEMLTQHHARTLAARWNFCNGISNEILEQRYPEGVLAKINNMEAEIAELLKFVGAFASYAAGYNTVSTFAQWDRLVRDSNEILEKYEK